MLMACLSKELEQDMGRGCPPLTDHVANMDHAWLLRKTLRVYTGCAPPTPLTPCVISSLQTEGHRPLPEHLNTTGKANARARMSWSPRVAYMSCYRTQPRRSAWLSVRGECAVGTGRQQVPWL